MSPLWLYKFQFNFASYLPLQHPSQVHVLISKRPLNVNNGKDKAYVQALSHGKLTWRNNVRRRVAFVNPVVSLSATIVISEMLRPLLARVS